MPTPKSTMLFCFLLASSLIAYFNSCTWEEKKSKFTYDIPSNRGQEDWMLEHIRPQVYPLQLDSLEKGFDSIQIRIWQDAAWNPKIVHVIKKRSNSGWQAKRLFYHQTQDEKHNFIVDTTEPIKVYLLEPRAGWDSFFTSLMDQKIMDLPGMSDSILYAYSDGEGHEIEIATGEAYRFYSYHNIDVVEAETVIGLAKMQVIDSLIWYELEVKDSLLLNTSATSGTTHH